MKEPGKKYNDEDNMLVNDLRSIVSKARSKAFAAVNYSLVERNWRIGQRIVEQEQNGASRAEYGKHVIEVASAALTEEFGKGFSETNIRTFRKFFLIFNDLEIPQTLSAESNLPKHQTLSDESSLLPQKGQTQSAQSELRLLPWSHYERLIRVEDKRARDWYAKEAFEQGWSYRTLSRNINTLYYERLLMSKDKTPVEEEMKEKTQEFQQESSAPKPTRMLPDIPPLPRTTRCLLPNTSFTYQTKKTSEEKSSDKKNYISWHILTNRIFMDLWLKRL